MIDRASVHTGTPRGKTSKLGPVPFEMPKFEMPRFDIPKVAMPAAFREFAERGVAQCKDTYEKMKAAAEQAADLLEDTYATADKGASEYGLKVIEATRVNSQVTFDFASKLAAAKTLAEVVELSNAQLRKQFEALTQQSMEFSALAQKVATEAVTVNTASNDALTDLSAEELDRLAGEAWSNAAREALSKGLAVTGSRDGRRYRYHPDGRVDELGTVKPEVVTPTKAQNIPAVEMTVDRTEGFPFDNSKVEMPIAFREFAERGIVQAQEAYEKMKAAAEKAASSLQTPESIRKNVASEYGLKLIQTAQANTQVAFDFAGELITAKTLTEVIELSSEHARKQFEMLTKQSRELGALAQKVATETAEPIKSGMNKAFSKIA